MELDFYSGLVAALVAGGAELIFRWIPELIAVRSQKENKVFTVLITTLWALHQACKKSNIFLAFLVGLCFGRPLDGLAVGAVIELMFLGVFIVGAAVPPQPYLSTTLATILVIRAGITTEEALTLVIPVAVMSQLLFMAATSFNHVALGIAKRKAEEGDIVGVDMANTAWQWVQISVMLIPAFIAGFIGVPAIKGLQPAGWLMEGLGAVAGMLPALGFALLLYQMGTKMIGFLFLGMFTALYIKPDSLALAGCGVALALIYLLVTRDREDTSVPEAAPPERRERRLKLTDGDLTAMFWRHQNLFGVASWEVLGGLGFAQAMVPVIRRLYTTKEEISAALKRHMVFYNTNPWLGSLIPGVVASMEEERANGEPVDEAAIQGVKVAMMGPFGGVGDSLFWSTYMPIILAIAASWARSDSVALQWLAPITAGGSLIASMILIQYNLQRFGYRRGLAALQDLQQRNLLADLSKAATVVGQFVIGGLVVTLIRLKIRWAPSFFGTSPIQIQTILDSILPNLLPILLFFFCYWLLKKGKSAIFIMVVLLLISILGAYPINLPLFNNTSILGEPVKAVAEGGESLLLWRSVVGA